MKSDFRKPSPPAPWVRRALSDADEARVTHAHPRMQQLHAALRLIAEVTKDNSWMLTHDPDRELDEALRILIRATSVKRK